MKQFITIAAFSFLSLSTFARVINNPLPVSALNANGKFANTGFNIEGDKIVFSELPKKTTNICITDENGNIELFTDISRRNNTIDIATLPNGRHNITIKTGNELKTFGYYSGAVIKGHKVGC